MTTYNDKAKSRWVMGDGMWWKLDGNKNRTETKIENGAGNTGKPLIPVHDGLVKEDNQK